jgi:hypothetical protein
MKLVRIVTFILLTQTAAKAAVVKQLLNAQNLAIVELKNKESATVGDNFIISENKSQCLLEVIKVEKKIVTVSSNKCSDKSLLSIGKNIEKSLFDPTLIKPEEPKEAATTAPELNPQQETAPTTIENTKNNPESKSYKSLVIGFMLTPKILINGTAYNGSASEAGTFEYNFTSALKFGFEWSQFSKHSWNNGFLINYASLKFDKATSPGPISDTTTVSMAGGMTLLTIGYSGKYLWETFYLPLNLGLTSSTVDSTGYFTKAMKTQLYVGYGLGIAISEAFNFEITTNAYSISPISVIDVDVRRTFSHSPPRPSFSSL